METPYQKLIHDYLDGSINPDDEKSLFENLSSNPEWREELNFQMRMHEAMQKDLSSVTIPVKATAALYSSLGFQIPQQAAETLGSGLFVHAVQNKFMLTMFACLTSAIVVTFFPTNNSGPEKPFPKSVQKIQTESPIKPAVSDSHILKPNTGTQDVQHAAAERAHRASLDIGKFASIDYLTQSRIIGISSGGNIYFSNDGGSLWENLRSHTSKDLFGVNFSDSTNGIVVGAEGTILLTADAGKHWVSVASGTDANLIGIKYVTRDTIYACGARGTILRSTSGGLVWKKLESGTSSSLFSIHFENGSKGNISGEHGLILRTLNAGYDWEKIK